jgi:ribosomal protein S18 acetylase RimI-like enzyme
LIARIWRGAVRTEDADAYASYMEGTGIAAYKGTPGNRGVYMLRRETRDRCEFVMVSLWESLEAVKAFAGEDYEAAVFYPEDDRFLIERDEKSLHFEVAAALPGGARSALRDLAVRRADSGDAERIAQLLHDFNCEFEEPTPGPRVLARRVGELLETGEITVLLAGGEAQGLAVLRFRPALWKEALDCYLEELYVVPNRRGQGIGRALMEAAIEFARAQGAADMHLGTSEDDVAARALYEGLGFSNRGGRPEGPISYFYEREL